MTIQKNESFINDPDRKFSHVKKLTGYMRIAEETVVNSGRAGLSILDMPAGNGIFSETLRKHGHMVTCGDINSE